MQSAFKTILVPVDFSINTEVAVKKTLEIVGNEEAVVYLLHVYKNGILNRFNRSRRERTEKMLGQWKTSIEETMPSITVCRKISSGRSVQKLIIEKAIEWQIDLIVIGQKSNHSWFPFLNTVMPCSMAERAGCAVLTVKPGALNNKIRTMVMPVIDNITHHKMEAIIALYRSFKLRIHLVTFNNDNKAVSEFSAQSLLRMYQWLKESMHCPVEYAVLHGSNKAKAILDYAKKIDADILLLNTNSETKIGALNKHISDVLPPASRMQVLNIQTDMNTLN